MKKTIKLILFFMLIICALLIIPNISNAADTTANSEETLISAITSASAGDTITLQNNITVTKPIVITGEITIDGNGYTVAGSTDWTSTSGNQTMFTAQSTGAKLTLKDIDLNNGPKYGVQAYDGGIVILNNVSITGFRYGGVLVNGGSLEIIDLHLGTNGTGENNGIEVDKGAAVTKNPSLTMNGTLTSDEGENVIRIPEDSSLTDFTVTNTENTTNKIAVAGNVIAVTDKNDNILFESMMPDTVNPTTDEEKVILMIIAGDKHNRIAVDLGSTVTEDMLKSHIELDEGYEITGFYTDENYTTAFDFATALTQDTTVYAKVDAISNEEITPPAEEIPEEKDETPKTGVKTYAGLALASIVLSGVILVSLKKRGIKE